MHRSVRIALRIMSINKKGVEIGERQNDDTMCTMQHSEISSFVIN